MTTYAFHLKSYKLEPGVPIYVQTTPVGEQVRLDDPAVKVMTDLTKVRAVTITPSSTIEFALQIMIHAKVRLLVVVDKRDVLVGLVTARDIMGEKSLLAATTNRIPRDQVQVEQVMTPRAEIEPLHMRDVEHASVRDVVMALRSAGRQHAIVVEPRAEEDWILRGIFSATQIGRQLGIEISSDGRVQSFAEFERLLA
jgi:CBS domain-containing protein